MLQLAVTMDYSIFLWHSYNEQRASIADSKEAMAVAIHETLTSVVGSSITVSYTHLAVYKRQLPSRLKDKTIRKMDAAGNSSRYG